MKMELVMGDKDDCPCKKEKKYLRFLIYFIKK